MGRSAPKPNESGINLSDRPASDRHMYMPVSAEHVAWLVGDTSCTDPAKLQMTAPAPTPTLYNR
jgi:hypothetical protein